MGRMTKTERLTILDLGASGTPVSEIAKRTGRSAAAIKKLLKDFLSKLSVNPEISQVIPIAPVAASQEPEVKKTKSKASPSIFLIDENRYAEKNEKVVKPTSISVFMTPGGAGESGNTGTGPVVHDPNS